MASEFSLSTTFKDKDAPILLANSFKVIRKAYGVYLWPTGVSI